MYRGYGMAAHAGGWILHPNAPLARPVDAGLSMGPTSVSPDGRWVAFGWHGGRVYVYDSATGARVWQSPADSYAECRFSPDGRSLLTNLDSCCVFATGTWKPGVQLGPGSPRDATSELAILGHKKGICRLVELATGRELARLEDPEASEGEAAFSPDDTKLVTAAANGLRVWDLRRIRAGLAELGLDWAAPPFPNAPDGSKESPLTVRVDRGDIDSWLRGDDLNRAVDKMRREGDLVGALAAIQKVHAVTPDDAILNNYLAWLLAICPDPKLRDGRRAVELARKAVAARPSEWAFLRTIGLAHHVAGDDSAAVKALTRSLELRSDGDAADYFLLAAAHQKLGNKEQARTWYDKGVAWITANKHPHEAELSRLRADAEFLLGVEKQGPHAPPGRSPGKEK
jgi:Flp pilus assembly protein TadD